MRDVVLINGRVMTDSGVKRGFAVRLTGDRIVSIGVEEEVTAGAQPQDLNDGILLPGFIDVQVNGGGGVLFNDDPSVATIARIGAAHRAFGTTGFLPTLISDDMEKVALAIEATGEAIAQGVPGVLGVHIEGPFLNAEKKGIHDGSKMRRLDAAALDLLTSLPAGRMLVTLAPEMTTPDTIERLVRAGVIVSAGHSNADYATVRAALDRGMSGFTHLFNAMSPLTSRYPGVVGAALMDTESWCGIIVDGQHIDPMTLKIAMKCRQLRHFMLVTDAMPTVGTAAKEFVLQGRLIVCHGGACYDASGRLAGSNLDMATAVRNAISMLDLSLSEASAMASRNPAEFLQSHGQIGRIAPGYRADFVLVDDHLTVLDTWIGGVTTTRNGHVEH